MMYRVDDVKMFEFQLCSGCAVAEARTSTNEYLYKLFLECKDYIVATCQRKSWFEKVDEICQVSEYYMFVSMYVSSCVLGCVFIIFIIW